MWVCRIGLSRQTPARYKIMGYSKKSPALIKRLRTENRWRIYAIRHCDRFLGVCSPQSTGRYTVGGVGCLGAYSLLWECGCLFWRCSAHRRWRYYPRYLGRLVSGDGRDLRWGRRRCIRSIDKCERLGARYSGGLKEFPCREHGRSSEAWSPSAKEIRQIGICRYARLVRLFLWATKRPHAANWWC